MLTRDAGDQVEPSAEDSGLFSKARAGLVHHRRDDGEHPAKRSRRTICWISRFPGFHVWMYLTICLDLITLLHFAIAWISELPGFDLLLDFTISLILPFPGFDNFWDFTFS